MNNTTQKIAKEAAAKIRYWQGGITEAQIAAIILSAIEKAFRECKPEWVSVYHNQSRAAHASEEYEAGYRDGGFAATRDMSTAHASERKYSYCMIHNTFPADDEPCWQCVNKFDAAHASEQGAIELLHRLLDTSRDVSGTFPTEAHLQARKAAVEFLSQRPTPATAGKP